MIIVKDENKVKVRSEPNGPIEYQSKLGTDNLISNKKIAWKYKVAKPYVSIAVPIVEPKSYEILVDGIAETITAPTPAQIISKMKEDDINAVLDTVYVQLDQYAHNGAIENSLLYGDLLLYVTASEARQTVLMVATIFRTLFKAFRDLLKSAKKLNLVATIDVLSDLWLEYRYGWRPFIAECEALAEALTRVRPDGVKSAYGTSKKTNTLKKRKGFKTVDVETEDGFIFTYKPSLKVSSRITKAGFNYLHTDSSRNDDWLAILGLDIDSLLNTAWELIPFSFIVDMFLNIGNLLQTQNSSEQVDSFNYYRSHITEGSINLNCKKIQRLPYYKTIDVMSAFDEADICTKYDTRNEDGSITRNLELWSRSALAEFNSTVYSSNSKEFVYHNALGRYYYYPYGDRRPITDHLYTIGNYYKVNQRVGTSVFGCFEIITGTSYRNVQYLNPLLQCIPKTEPLANVQKLLEILLPPVPESVTTLWGSKYDDGFFSGSSNLFTKRVAQTLSFTPNHVVWPDKPEKLNEYRASWNYLGVDLISTPVVIAKLGKFHYKDLDISIFNRQLDKNFSHSFTVDADLSAGQVVDLLAIGNSLTKRFR